MLNKLIGRGEPPAEPTPPRTRWYTALTVYRDPQRPGNVARTVNTLRARTCREATLLFLAKAELGPPKLPGQDLTGWDLVRFDVSETGEDALEKQERTER